ncbi:hypothetical protein Shell_0891 [Staphylothermus hellenicus DSM 12710]|uniref:Uncharacterized protein n=1 Tax=Staphylothermus hellenicus (strain DSM 12710 / JCM 10830 / BK20S6-10-b1 / P8) TaxID=591019 RepID=D7D8A4_STAHD|nr:hypothetical protein Shell_0891 [Staphylothermus hellenicus DSM 12710]
MHHLERYIDGTVHSRYSKIKGLHSLETLSNRISYVIKRGIVHGIPVETYQTFPHKRTIIQ